MSLALYSLQHREASSWEKRENKFVLVCRSFLSRLLSTILCVILTQTPQSLTYWISGRLRRHLNKKACQSNSSTAAVFWGNFTTQTQSKNWQEGTFIVLDLSIWEQFESKALSQICGFTGAFPCLINSILLYSWQQSPAQVLFLYIIAWFLEPWLGYVFATLVDVSNLTSFRVSL